MPRSAHQLGYEFGLSSQKMNLLLADQGYLAGSPGSWELTEKGQQYASERWDDNGYGGSHGSSWVVRLWNDDLPDALRADVDANPHGVRDTQSAPDDLVLEDAMTNPDGVSGDRLTMSQKQLIGGAVVLGVAALAAPLIKPLWQKKLRPGVDRVRARFRQDPPDEQRMQSVEAPDLDESSAPNAVEPS